MALEELEEGILKTIEQGDAEECKRLLEQFLKKGGDLLALISRGTKLMQELGQKFEKGEIYLPDVMMAAEAFSLLTEALKSSKNYEYLLEVLIKTWSSAGFIERTDEIIKRDRPRIWGTFGVVERDKGVFKGVFFDVYYCPHRRIRIRLL